MYDNICLTPAHACACSPSRRCTINAASECLSQELALVVGTSPLWNICACSNHRRVLAATIGSAKSMKCFDICMCPTHAQRVSADVKFSFLLRSHIFKSTSTCIHVHFRLTVHTFWISMHMFHVSVCVSFEPTQYYNCIHHLFQTVRRHVTVMFQQQSREIRAPLRRLTDRAITQVTHWGTRSHASGTLIEYHAEYRTTIFA